jgi:hypothetical protein
VDPPLLVGPWTLDVVARAEQPGGAVAYGARALSALGIAARVVTVAHEGADLSALDGHSVHVRHERRAYRFEHEPGPPRRLRARHPPASPLTLADVPPDWRAPAFAAICPLLPDDVDVPSLLDVDAGHVGLLAQGLCRERGGDGVIRAARAPAPILFDDRMRNVTVFVSSEDVEGWPGDGLPKLAERARRVVLTDGPRGARVLERGIETRVAPAPPSACVDPTGAGDTFALAFLASLDRGVPSAGAVAARLAAASLTVRGPGVLAQNATE